MTTLNADLILILSDLVDLTCCAVIMFLWTSSILHGDQHCDASQQEGPEFDATIQLGLFCVQFACSPHVHMGSLWALRFLPTI